MKAAVNKLNCTFRTNGSRQAVYLAWGDYSNMQALYPRIVFWIVVVLHFVGNMLVYPIGRLLEESSEPAFIGYALGGVLLGEIGLVALGSAWAGIPATKRWPLFVFVLVLGTLAVFVGMRVHPEKYAYVFDPNIDPYIIPLFSIMAGGAFVCALVPLAVTRLITKHSIVRQDPSLPDSQLASHQFSIASLATWTAGVALLLALGRAVPPQLFGAMNSKFLPVSFILGYATGMSLVYGVALAALGGPVAAIVLSDRRPVGYSLLVAAGFSLLLCLFEFVLASTVATAISWSNGSRNAGDFVIRLFVNILACNAGIFVEIATVLMVFRCLGYRRVRTAAVPTLESLEGRSVS